MKKIWIIAPFSNIDTAGLGNRFKYLAERLTNEDFEVTLFTSNFSHRKKTHISEEAINDYPYVVKLVNELGYNNNVSIKRAISHINFSRNLKSLLKVMEKPDIVYAAYPTMSGAYIAGKYAKKNNLPFVVDVQDTWPESISAAINTDKRMVRLLMWPFTKYANAIYKMADLTFGVSKTYVQRANIKGTKCRDFIPVYIGTELEKFNNTYYVKKGTEKKDNDIWCTYIGTLSHSYDIETAIKAFAELESNKEIKLNILGTGPDEERLIRLSQELGIWNVNVFFYGLVDYDEMLNILKETDIALNSLTKGSKGTITNKLGDYLSARLPILNSCQEKEVIELIDNNQLGINYEPGSVDSLKDSIVEILNNGKMRDYSRNSEKLAKKYFDRKISYKVIIDKLSNI